MTDHPITPPPELVQQWYDQAKQDPCGPINWVAVKAAQWGADQELEACVKWLNSYMPGTTGDQLLRPFRRPKPPSLKEQALETLKYPKDLWSELEVDTIRLALEALPND
jgi:hypothetical protein